VSQKCDAGLTFPFSLLPLPEVTQLPTVFSTFNSSAINPSLEHAPPQQAVEGVAAPGGEKPCDAAVGLVAVKDNQAAHTEARQLHTPSRHLLPPPHSLNTLTPDISETKQPDGGGIRTGRHLDKPYLSGIKYRLRSDLYPICERLSNFLPEAWLFSNSVIIATTQGVMQASA